MKYVCLFLILAVATDTTAQSPVLKTLAYSRDTIRGTPESEMGTGSSQTPFPASYFIYVVVEKGTVVSVTGVCVKGKAYAATWKRVESPVMIEHDASVPTGKKDTLVEKTADDVYQVELGPMKAAGCKDNCDDQVAQRNQVVVFLKSGQAGWRGLAERIIPLQPAAAP